MTLRRSADYGPLPGVAGLCGEKPGVLRRRWGYVAPQEAALLDHPAADHPDGRLTHETTVHPGWAIFRSW